MLQPGEAIGLLGPNGAGKSTTMWMLGAVSTRTGGRLEILGLHPDRHGPEIRAQLGVVPGPTTSTGSCGSGTT
ncbi:MAG: ATP-binding cassette protein [Naasia sp.]|nr:ATP-binding cassette protein [Naasia sp.]